LAHMWMQYIFQDEKTIIFHHGGIGDECGKGKELRTQSVFSI
jgi:hypothetical protein